jgi:hypothetical protein
VNVTIDEHYTVPILGDFSGPFIDLTLSPTNAYDLLRRLKEKESQLYDLATNYYECEACGNIHPNTAKPCPNIEPV